VFNTRGGTNDVDGGDEDGPDDSRQPRQEVADDRDRETERVDVDDVIGNDTQNLSEVGTAGAIVSFMKLS
jgi:hypothetical protein